MDGCQGGRVRDKAGQVTVPQLRSLLSLTWLIPVWGRVSRAALPSAGVEQPTRSLCFSVSIALWISCFATSNYLFRKALQRDFTDSEKQSMIECLEGSMEHFGGREDDWLHGRAAGLQPFHQPLLLEVRKH